MINVDFLNAEHARALDGEQALVPASSTELTYASACPSHDQVLVDYTPVWPGSVFDSDGWRPIFTPLGNEAGIECIDMRRCGVPLMPELGTMPHISVRTLSYDEINERHLAGEDAGDLLHDYSSYFWFSDRASYRAAARLARMISKGGRIDGPIEPRIISDCDAAFGEVVSITVDLSPHHLAGAA